MSCVVINKFFLSSFARTEEDAYNSYANFLAKYFLAEGVMCGHALFVAGPSIHTADILKVWKTDLLVI